MPKFEVTVEVSISAPLKVIVGQRLGAGHQSASCNRLQCSGLHRVRVPLHRVHLCPTQATRREVRSLSGALCVPHADRTRPGHHLIAIDFG